MWPDGEDVGGEHDQQLLHGLSRAADVASCENSIYDTVGCKALRPASMQRVSRARAS